MARVIRRPGPGAQRLRMLLKNLRGASVKVGFFEGHAYEDGTPIAMVAVWIEHGTSTSPPRPIFRITVTERKEEWRELARLLAGRAVRGELTLLQAMDQLGAAAAGHLSRTIAALTEPELAESTIQNRMRRKADEGTVGNLDKPLIDRGLLFAAVSWQSEGKE